MGNRSEAPSTTPKGALGVKFFGSFDYQMDDRNRVPIPPVYRSEFESGGVVATGTEPCVVLYTRDAFHEAAAAVEALPATDEGDAARRDFYGLAFPVQKDGQGRVLLVRELIDHASLRKEVKVVGVGRHMEIWDRAAWDAGEQQRKATRKAARNAAGRAASAPESTGA